MNDTGLIGDAAPAAEVDKKPEETSIAHREAAPTEKPAERSDGAEWIQGLTTSLYKEGKPNFEVLPEKYWKDGTPDLGSALKARAELEKAFSRGDHKAPAEYDVSFAKEQGIPDDDPLLGSFKGWAKENGISQDAFKKLASEYIKIQTELANSVRVDVEAEKQKLGPNADKVIQEMVGWGQNMVRKGIWSVDDFEEFKIMGGTARGLNALMKVREYYGDMQRIPVDTAAIAERPSRDELNAMVADPRYKSDPSFRAKVERMFEEAYSS